LFAVANVGSFFDTAKYFMKKMQKYYFSLAFLLLFRAKRRIS